MRLFNSRKRKSLSFLKLDLMRNYLSLLIKSRNSSYVTTSPSDVITII